MWLKVGWPGEGEGRHWGWRLGLLGHYFEPVEFHIQELSDGPESQRGGLEPQNCLMGAFRVGWRWRAWVLAPGVCGPFVICSFDLGDVCSLLCHSSFAHPLGAEHLPGGSWRHTVMSWHPPLFKLKLAAWKRGYHLAVHNPSGAEAGTEYRCPDPWPVTSEALALGPFEEQLAGRAPGAGCWERQGVSAHR